MQLVGSARGALQAVGGKEGEGTRERLVNNEGKARGENGARKSTVPPVGFCSAARYLILRSQSSNHFSRLISLVSVIRYPGKSCQSLTFSSFGVARNEPKITPLT